MITLLVLLFVVIYIVELQGSDNNLYKNEVNDKKLEELILNNRLEDVFDSIKPIDTTNDAGLESLIRNYKREKDVSSINNKLYRSINSRNDIEHTKKHNDKAKTYFNKHFKKMNRPDSSYKHELLFAITQQNLEELYRQLLDVSDIYSGNYGKYKSCLLYTSPSPRDRQKSRMPSSA